MTRLTIALLWFGLLIAWADGSDRVVLPYNHPANPQARSAPPIPVPRIEAPDIKDTTPDPAGKPLSPREQSSSPEAGTPMHHHQH